MIKPDINFYVDSLNTLNFQFIVNKLEGKDTTLGTNPFAISIREINIINADFSLRSYYYMPRSFGINFTNLHLKPLDVYVTNFRVDHGVSMNIRSLSAKDHSGFILERLSARFKINKENLTFNNLELVMPKSEIEANQVYFNFKSTKEFKTGVLEKR